MEEKKRYEIVYFDNDTSWKIIDNKTKQEVGGIDDMIKLLNQQDKRIKEMEEYIKSKENCNEWLTMADNDNLQKENQQLKQQLHDLPKKLVEEIKNVTTEIEFRDCRWLGKQAVYDKLDTILKKFGGE